MRRVIWAAALLLCLGSMASFADVIVTPINGPTFGTVHFNNGDASPPLAALTGTTVTGYSLDAIGTDIRILGDAIRPQVGTSFSDITFEPSTGFPNYTKLIADFTVSDNGKITFSTAPDGVMGTDTFSVSKNGSNFFTITASNGQSIASMTATLSTGDFTKIDQVRVRVGPATTVPEPETVGMMLAGLGAIAVGLRRKKA